MSWARLHVREFPWRHLKTSVFNLLMAELLLKRTTVTAAARIYGPFVSKYPSITDLAVATEDELARLLAPIGLSCQRARSIRKLALVLESQVNGIPSTMNELRALPGIGEYTAQAVMSFGHGVPVAIVDGNVERVIGRVFQTLLKSSSDGNTIRRIASDLLPKEHHRSFNFALIDLGSVVCRPANPRCKDCPLQDLCDYAWAPAGRKTNSSLKNTRQARGYSLTRLANMAGVSKNTVINIEAGRVVPRRTTLKKLAHAMGAPISQLDQRLALRRGKRRDANVSAR